MSATFADSRYQEFESEMFPNPTCDESGSILALSMRSKCRLPSPVAARQRPYTTLDLVCGIIRSGRPRDRWDNHAFEITFRPYFGFSNGPDAVSIQSPLQGGKLASLLIANGCLTNTCDEVAGVVT
jgi:hypothetical protein